MSPKPADAALGNCDFVGEPGTVRKEPWPSPHGGRLVARGVGGYQRFDSLALDAEGRICVATLINGGITVISPDGRHIEHHPMPDPITTNICFGGADMRTAFIPFRRCPGLAG